MVTITRNKLSCTTSKSPAKRMVVSAINMLAVSLEKTSDLNNNKKQKRMTTIKLLLKWLYGIGFSVSGLVLMFSTSFIGGLIFIIGGLILLPPTLKMIEDKIGSPLTRPIKYLTVIGTIFIGIIYIANNHVDKENETKKQEQEAFEKLPQHVKDSINLVKAQQDR